MQPTFSHRTKIKNGKSVMKLKLLYFAFFSILLPFYLNGQNLKDYKWLFKVNLSDALVVGRYTFEGEMPIFKNTSLLLNLGLHSKDYFYDDRERTQSNIGMSLLLPQTHHKFNHIRLQLRVLIKCNCFFSNSLDISV